VASANDIDFTTNSLNITGTTQINRIADPGGSDTVLLRLHFNAAVTVATGQATGAIKVTSGTILSVFAALLAIGVLIVAGLFQEIRAV